MVLLHLVLVSQRDAYAGKASPHGGIKIPLFV